MEKDNKVALVISLVWCTAVTCAIICGLLECFNISTGTLGGFVALVTILPLSIIILWFICCWVLKLLYPEWEEEKTHRIGIYVVIFLFVNSLWFLIF